VARVIVLDAGVLIGFLDTEDAHHDRALDLLERQIDEDFFVSSLTLAEVLVVPARQGRLEEVRQAMEDLDVRELPFPADTAVKLAQLRASTNLKMPDCCVLLAAEEATGARLASFDDRLLDAARSRRLATVHGCDSARQRRLHRTGAIRTN
jgi:predicted nucleic acid-binding protein